MHGDSEPLPLCSKHEPSANEVTFGNKKKPTRPRFQIKRLQLYGKPELAKCLGAIGDVFHGYVISITDFQSALNIEHLKSLLYFDCDSDLISTANTPHDIVSS